MEWDDFWMWLIVAICVAGIVLGVYEYNKESITCHARGGEMYDAGGSYMYVWITTDAKTGAGYMMPQYVPDMECSK